MAAIAVATLAPLLVSASNSTMQVCAWTLLKTLAQRAVFLSDKFGDKKGRGLSAAIAQIDGVQTITSTSAVSRDQSFMDAYNRIRHTDINGKMRYVHAILLDRQAMIENNWPSSLPHPASPTENTLSLPPCSSILQVASIPVDAISISCSYTFIECLNQLEEVLKEIQELASKLELQIVRYNQRWLPSYSTPSHERTLLDIERIIPTLEARIKRFVTSIPFVQIVEKSHDNNKALDKNV